MTDDEYTDDVRAAHRRIDTLDAKLQELSVALLGDLEARECYETNKKNNVTPNIVQPPLGIVELLEAKMDGMARLWADYQKDILSRMTELQKEQQFNQQLKAFFSPLLAAGKDAVHVHQIADKEYVDKGLERLAQAIRGELVLAYGGAKDLVGALLKTPLSKFDTSKDNYAVTTWSMIAERLSRTWARDRDREELEHERARKPSRVQSLIHAVTGYSKPTSTNGVHR